MTTFSRGDVVLVAFPFSSGQAGKQRPALVVSSNQYNSLSPDLMVVSITSNLQAVPHHGDHAITDWQEAGLLKPSLSQAKVATIEASMVQRKLGTLRPEDLLAVEAGLREALGL